MSSRTENYKKLNEYGLEVPSNNVNNYTPNVNEGANLLSATTNYMKNAIQKRNVAVRAYKEERARRMANGQTVKKTNRRVGRKLFGGKKTRTRRNRGPKN